MPLTLYIRWIIPFFLFTHSSSSVIPESSKKSLLRHPRVASREKARRKAARFIFAMPLLKNLPSFCGFSIMGEFSFLFSKKKLSVINFCILPSEYSIYRATVPEWTAILKIACVHDFPGIKDFALQGLEGCDIPIANRIKLYQQYDAGSRYINPLYVKFCLREDGPTDEETDVMGTKVSLIVYRARERLRGHATPQNGGNTFAESDALKAISSILGYNNAPSKGLGSVSFYFNQFAPSNAQRLWSFSQIDHQKLTVFPVTRRNRESLVMPRRTLESAMETHLRRCPSLQESSSREAFVYDNYIFQGNCTGNVIQSDD